MHVKTNVVFVSLARNQSTFFQAVGALLQQYGHGIFHVCFHEGAVRDLRNAGCVVFSPYENWPTNANVLEFEEFQIANPSLILGHEKSAYELSNTSDLIRKLKGHLAAMSTIVDELIARGDSLLMVQELGGFTSVIAAYYAARRRGVNHWFIEPSFFKGRVFFTENSFAAPQVPSVSSVPSSIVNKILDGMVESRALIIPTKDRLQYRGAVNKLLDSKNLRRLFEKLFAKYICNEREEFQHIRGHVARHLRMFFNSRKLKSLYTELTKEEDFIYYPLHVPSDFALTIRSPEYLDQYSLIDYLCRVAPLGYQVVTKEHPALVGAISPSRIKELCKLYDNFKILPADMNNHEVLASANVVVTVNSKSGAEALLHGTPVVVLGDAFYKTCGKVHGIDALSELQSALIKALDPSNAFKRDSVLPFFQAVWEESHCGDLYNNSVANVKQFADSIASCIARRTRNAN